MEGFMEENGGVLLPNLIGELFLLSIPVTSEDKKPYNEQDDHDEE